MTHQELLAKIDYYLEPTKKLTGDDAIKNSAIGLMKALQSVVILHKPRQTTMNVICCATCSEKTFVAFPCSTFSAIEKELV